MWCRCHVGGPVVNDFGLWVCVLGVLANGGFGFLVGRVIFFFFNIPVVVVDMWVCWVEKR